MSVTLENDGITVRQTVATHHTTVAAWARYAMWFTPFDVNGTIIRSLSKPSCRNSGAGPYDTATMGPGEEYIIFVGGLNKYTSYITLQSLNKSISALS